MEEVLVPRAGLSLETISGGGMHCVGLAKLFRNGWRLVRGWGQARRLVRRYRPDVFLLTGGYTNGPVALAAWERHLPMVIFLPDIEPGLAIRVLSRLATRVACTAEASKAYLPPSKMVVTGYPVRPDLLPAMSQAEARATFSLQPDLPTLLVFGGSRGARTINHALLDILPELLADYQVIHISGQLDWELVTARASELVAELRVRYRPFSYLHEEMGRALRAADLAISRAGAATLGEFPACGLPAVLIPYPYAWRYQKVNADYLAAAGAAVRLDDQDLATQLLPTVRRLMGDCAMLGRMRAAAHALDRPGAARQVADLLISLSAGGNP
jgi:UDP-N-acetylglucosamine--N-acetylmuramyl-(pentapeptide) pyrophosphoryl-undecaprenol N-acetylglucosamine transferase